MPAMPLLLVLSSCVDSLLAPSLTTISQVEVCFCSKAAQLGQLCEDLQQLALQLLQALDSDVQPFP